MKTKFALGRGQREIPIILERWSVRRAGVRATRGYRDEEQ